MGACCSCRGWLGSWCAGWGEGVGRRADCAGLRLPRELDTPARDARAHEVVGVARPCKASCWATRPRDADDLVSRRWRGVSPAAGRPHAVRAMIVVVLARRWGP